MGCASSKLEDLPAVLLCRHRVDNLSQALQRRYVLSQTHISYVNSIQSLGLSLHHFFDTAAAAASSSSSPPPPPSNHRKIAEESEVSDVKKSVDKKSNNNNSGGHLTFDDDDAGDSDDGSGSHLHFHSSDDEIDDDHVDGKQEMGGFLSSSSGGGGMMMYDEGSSFGPGRGSGYNPYMYGIGGVTMNYMKRHVTPSVAYEQRPMSYETQTVQFGDPSSSFSNGGYYDYFGGGGGGGSGFYGPQSGAQRGGFYGAPMGVQPMKQQEQAPPPPPPPPAASGWDFMNFFESIDNHYPTYRTPSRDSREVREEEGIPDLEDEDFDHEVVKEVVHGHKKVAGDEVGESSISSGEGDGGGGETKEVEEEVVVGKSEVESGNVYRGRPSASIESAPVEYEVRVVDKKVIGEEGKGGGDGGGGGRPGFRNVFEVVKEIQVQFERAANCGNELGNLLEVGKLRYQRKNAAFQGLEIRSFTI